MSTRLGRRGGCQVVNALAFFFRNPCSNPYNFLVILLLKITKINKMTLWFVIFKQFQQEQYLVTF